LEIPIPENCMAAKSLGERHNGGAPMNPCPYDHAEMKGYGHQKCPYCKMALPPVACSLPPDRTPYTQAEEIADRLMAKGCTQKQCALCKLWRWEHQQISCPDFSEENAYSTDPGQYNESSQSAENP
jgi:hypothetical protein